MDTFRFIASERIPPGMLVAVDPATGKIRVAYPTDQTIGITYAHINQDEEVELNGQGRVTPVTTGLRVVAPHIARNAPISDEDARRVMSCVIELLAQGVSPDRLIDELKHIRRPA